MFYESLIAQEVVHVLDHVENDVSSIFKLTFHWYDVYRNRLHELSDTKNNLRFNKMPSKEHLRWQ